MAQTVSSRPLWLAGAIAAGIVVLVVAVFAIPPILSCSSGGQFGTCMRERLVDVGLASPIQKTLPTPMAIPDKGTVVPPSQDAEVAKAVKPDFDILRAEPDGSVVVAGTAAPDAQVNVYSDGKLLGSTTADATGDWAFVPDEKLPAGGQEITVTAPETGQSSDRSIVVVIADNKTDEPLVVATAPGEADSVLQGLSRPGTETADKTAVAGEERTAPAESVADNAATTPGAKEPSAPDSATTAAVNEQAAQTDFSVAALETAPAIPAPGAAGSDATASVTAKTPQPDIVKDEAAKPTEPAATDPASAKPDTQMAATESAVGDVDALTKQIDALTPAVPPSIDAIEIDGDKNFFAGGGENGATVRLYVDNQHIGDAKVKEGRWLLQTDDVLEERSQRVRVDQLAPGSAEVTGRAEVNFVFKIPAQEASDETAVGEADASGEPAAPSQTIAVRKPKAGAAKEAATPDKSTAVDTEKNMTVASADAAGSDGSAGRIVPPSPDFSINTDAPVAFGGNEAASPAAGTATNPSETAMAAGGAGTGAMSPEGPNAAGAGVTASGGANPSSDISVATNGAGAGQSGATAALDGSGAGVAVSGGANPAAAGTPAAGSASITKSDTATAMADTGSESDVPTLVAEPVGDPRNQRYASGKAIIRSGDNLWTIASRVYGSGYEFITIYRANKDQIRNPDLIYPGQVFDLPAPAQ